MSQEVKKILPVIFVVAALGLGYLSWTGYEDALTIQNQVNDSKTKVAELRTAAEKTNNFSTYIKENPDVSGKLNIALSDDSNKPSAVAVLSTAAFTNSLLLKKIELADSKETPAAGLAVEKPSAQDVKLSFNGTYSSLKNFLIFTEKSLKLMDVASIDFKSAAAEKDKSQAVNYDFTIALKAYYVPKKDSISNEGKILIANNLTEPAFLKNKQFTDLVPPQNYNVDATDTGDWGNKNIF